MDFFLKIPEGARLSQGQRRNFRHNLVDDIIQNEYFAINSEDVQRGDSHRFFKAPIKYTRLFEQASLRPYLQLEMTFSQPRLAAQTRKTQSIVSSVTGQEPETEILCISPLETAGDKLSALT